MIAALLLATAPVTTAVDAERAFARDAQRLGQWTAFRRWAHPTAVMFTPQATWAQGWLKGRANPPRAVRWAPARSFVSCDGRTAVNSGPWRGPGNGGTFTTLWMRQANGTWRWTVDGGDEAGAPRPLNVRPTVRRASCTNRALRLRQIEAAYAAPINRAQPPGDTGYSQSADGTLLYQWKVSPGGARQQQAKLWTGRRFQLVLDQRIAAPPAR
jgi:hypothetical protein